ncbi:hypothetical protein JMJ56_31980 [Belnapia sp. T18]|uniref:Glycosyltransferase n=1 Tax=Belnapia arida TaxID=2804533 RepID=A0ABS1UH21_9PROT|nr:hypothetical protein [Belnapia arida]MBL6082586.1 hypothetical protein [Belnapia arida]
MTKIQCFTSFSFSYLTRAIMLARTLKAVHPDWQIWAMLVDEPPPNLDPDVALADFDSYIYAKDLGFPNFSSWIFKHDIVEACTAVKGQMMSHLLNSDADKVFYFDPDIAIFHPLDSLVSKLNASSILLTPHQVDANSAEGVIRDNEITSLKYGIFNLGFVAVKNDTSGRKFANWWAKQLYIACYDEVENGIFTDQKWCDLVPALFDKVKVERDPGCNVASWNLSTRRISFNDKGVALVNGSPLKFYHYTKINAAGDLMTEKYAGDNVEILEVWNWYKKAIKHIHMDGIPSGYWSYGKFNNGVKISKGARVFYRNRPDLMKAFSDPFHTEGNSYFNWIRQEMPELLSESGKRGFEAI